MKYINFLILLILCIVCNILVTQLKNYIRYILIPLYIYFILFSTKKKTNFFFILLNYYKYLKMSLNVYIIILYTWNTFLNITYVRFSIILLIKCFVRSTYLKIKTKSLISCH